MNFSIFRRGIYRSAIMTVLALFSIYFYPSGLFAQADDKLTSDAGKRSGAYHEAMKESEERPADAELKNKNSADSLSACRDNMIKLIPKIKFYDRAAHVKFIDIGCRIKRINDAIKNDCILYSPDGTSDKMKREQLDEMLAKENELLDLAKDSISHTREELDEMAARAVKVESGSHEKPIICPEKGVYSITQDDRLRYKAKCSVHGSYDEINDKLYEMAMKNTDPAKFCSGNKIAVTGACEQYCIEYGVPKEWSLEMLIEEGFLEGKCVCPSGGVYTIKGGPGKIFNCSCSVHK